MYAGILLKNAEVWKLFFENVFKFRYEVGVLF